MIQEQVQLLLITMFFQHSQLLQKFMILMVLREIKAKVLTIVTQVFLMGSIGLLDKMEQLNLMDIFKIIWEMIL